MGAINGAERSYFSFIPTISYESESVIPERCHQCVQLHLTLVAMGIRSACWPPRRWQPSWGHEASLTIQKRRTAFDTSVRGLGKGGWQLQLPPGCGPQCGHTVGPNPVIGLIRISSLQQTVQCPFHAVGAYLVYLTRSSCHPACHPAWTCPASSDALRSLRPARRHVP